MRFSDLVDVTRRDIVVERPLRGVGSLKELAFDLGYSAAAHFTRTFRRWTGAAPSEYRDFGAGTKRI